MIIFFRSHRRAITLACACAISLIATAGAQPAAAKTVVFRPCSSGASVFAPITAQNAGAAQWTLEARCPSELTLAPTLGSTLGSSNPGFEVPSTDYSHGVFTNVSFDLLGGNGSGTGLEQGIRACRKVPAACGPLVTTATNDVTTLEHHEMTLANGQVPAGSDFLRVYGRCPTAPTTPCASDRPLTIRNLAITFEDNSAPTLELRDAAAGEPIYDDDGDELPPVVGIPLLPYEWNTGTREIRVRATDVGAGVKYIEFDTFHHSTTTGRKFSQAAPSCGGSTYASVTIAFTCPLAMLGTHAIKLPDAGIQWGMDQGRNIASVIAHDAAGNDSEPLVFDFMLDNIRPIVKNLEVAPPPANRWHASPRIGLRWLNDGEQFETEAESGVVKAHFKVTSDDLGTSTFIQGDELGVAGTVIDSIPLIELPGAGRWNVAVTTLDKAGNSSKPSVAKVWVDPSVPDKPIIDPIQLLSAAQLTSGANATWSPPANADAMPSGICSYAVAVDQSAHTDPDHLVAATKLFEKLDSVLPGGSNYVHVQAISCAGVKSEIADLKFEVDSLVPTASVTTPGPGGWYSPQFPFAASITGSPDPGTLISIVISGSPDAWSSAPTVTLGLPDAASDVTLKVKDAAGNESLQLLHVKSDSNGPTINFEPIDPSHPTLISASGSDGHSGIHETSMRYRASGSGEWHSLGDVVRPAGGTAPSAKLSARFPDGDLPSGAYELRLHASDFAGNESFASAFADGSAAIVNLPLRAPSTLSAGFAVTVKSKRCTGKGKKRKCQIVAIKNAKGALRESALIEYGAGDSLNGKLTATSGAPIAGAELKIFEAIGGGSDKLLKVLTTGPLGEYSYMVNAGPSRALKVRFAGNETNADASASARFLTKAKITLKLIRVKTEDGWRIDFSGRVLADGAAIPATGKAVRLQFRSRSGWDEFPVLATDRIGKFKYSRNFNSTGRPIRYRFRALVPWSDGWIYESGMSAVKAATLK